MWLDRLEPRRSSACARRVNGVHPGVLDCVRAWDMFALVGEYVKTIRTIPPRRFSTMKASTKKVTSAAVGR